MYAIRVYVCTCIGVEARLREVSRQLSLSELAREKLSSELEVLKLQAQDGQQWETEKQVNIYFSHTPCACINCYTVNIIHVCTKKIWELSRAHVYNTCITIVQLGRKTQRVS